MITEDYVSFETAKLLNEKGFSWETCAYWDLTTETHTPKIVIKPTPRNWNYKWKIFVLPMSAPTLQMAMKWLREKYYLFVDIDPLTGYKWTWSIWFMNDPTQKMGEASGFFSTNEQACEAAIKYCLENLIKYE